MSDSIKYVVFLLEGQRYALALGAVGRIVRAVEITPLPKAPAIVLGLVDVGGLIVPVFNLRRRFRIPEREIILADHLIVAHTSRRTVALVVDKVQGVFECAESSVVDPRTIVPGLNYVEGVVQLEDGMVLIHDLEKFLSADEDRELSRALEGR